MPFLCRRSLLALAIALGVCASPGAAIAATSVHKLAPRADTDRDSLVNRTELREGCNPRNPDSDGDGMGDGFEVRNRLNCHNKRDAALDIDGDGLRNGQEFAYGTNPRRADSDGDMLNDWVERVL